MARARATGSAGRGENHCRHFVWVMKMRHPGEMSSSDQMPSFFLRGWREETAEDFERESRARKISGAGARLSAAGLSERVSEVN
jgi:hypothetical protein